MKDEVVKKLLQYLGNVESFLSSELPATLKEFVSYGIVSNLVFLIISVVILGLSITLVFKSFKIKAGRGYETLAEGSVKHLIGAIMGFTMGTISLITGLLAVSDFLMAYLAPRVYLIHLIKAL